MNNSLDKALYYLTGNGNIDTVPIEELEKLVDNHPYFPVAHFLLSKKLKKENSPHFLQEVQKTALYFPNPYWLHYQLLNNLPDEPIVYDTEEPLVETEDEFEQTPHDVIEDEPKDLDLVPDTDPKPIIDTDEHPITTEFSLDEIEAASKLAHETLKEDAEIVDEPVEPVNTSEQEQDFEVDHVAVDDVKEEEYAIPTDSTEIKTNTAVNEEVASQESYHEVISEPEEKMAAITRDTDEATTEFLDEVENTELQKENINEEIENAPVTEAVEAEKPEEDEHEKMFQNIKAMLDASAEEANADVKTSVVPIDPYYTIDYFAAQGIKLDLENPQDKLGKQVKKFTQWLKHMKKLGPEDTLTSDGPTQAEVEAQQTADASNIAREVVTEAMATVLEKQGKKEKAIQLYRKLSFLNPHKSAYFADKINNLNGL